MHAVRNEKNTMIVAVVVLVMNTGACNDATSPPQPPNNQDGTGNCEFFN